MDQNGRMSALPSPRPSVLVFATGGTIGMRDTDSGLAPDPDFPEVLGDLVEHLCAPIGADHRVNQLLPAIDSANADADTAPRIARAVIARVRTQRPRGVVITHGTDTLAYTAARLAFELNGIGAPVILTGSQLPHGAPGTDAFDNLSLAIRASLRAAPAAPVSIAFGGKLLPAVRSTKHDSRSFEAFRAESALATGAEGVPALQSENAPGRPARVLSFRFTPAVTASDLRAFAAAEPDGLVLECYGSGNAPTARPGMLGVLRELCNQMPVVAITQSATGGVDLTRYAVGRELAATGVIDGADLTLEAAVSKLGFLLDRGCTGDELRSLMERNLVGELTSR